MKPKISLITLGVADLRRAVQFYRDGLKLPLRPGYDEKASIAFFQLQGTWLALFPWADLAQDAGVWADGSGFRGFTLAHNVGSAEEVEKTLAEAVAAGAKLVKRGGKTDWGGYDGYFADPDGFLWEVAWNPFIKELE